MAGRLSFVAGIIVLSLFAQVAPLSAAPSNGTRFPPKGRVESGYEYNLIERRDLGRSYGVIKTEDHFYTLSIGILDWLALDGKIGLGDVRQKGGIHLPKIEYRSGFAGGYGLRIRVFENKKYGLRLVMGGQHISVHPQDRSVDDNKFESFLDDWQVSCLLAKDFKDVSLYAGVKGSDCEIVYKINKKDKKRRFSEGHIGLITGAELYFFDRRLRANAEARFFDEQAISCGISYLF